MFCQLPGVTTLIDYRGPLNPGPRTWCEEAMSGGAPISNDAWMYPLTDKGLALKITAKSTK